MLGRMKFYSLYVNTSTINEVGAKVDNWELVKSIPVIINFTSLNLKTSDVRYKDCQFSGIANYKGLDLSKQYKLVKDNETYLIKSINEFARYAQYILQRVI